MTARDRSSPPILLTPPFAQFRERIRENADLSRTIRAMKPGTKTTLNVWRGGKTRDVPVTIAEFKDEEAPKVAAKASKKPEVKPGKQPEVPAGS